jgi:hypothetical protein
MRPPFHVDSASSNLPKAGASRIPRITVLLKAIALELNSDMIWSYGSRSSPRLNLHTPRYIWSGPIHPFDEPAFVFLAKNSFA